jgi:hypothetical protein
MAGGDGALTVKARRGHAVVHRRFLADILPGLAGALIVRLARLLALLASANARAALIGVLAALSHVHAAEKVPLDLLLVLPLLPSALSGRTGLGVSDHSQSESKTCQTAQNITTGGNCGQVGLDHGGSQGVHLILLGASHPVRSATSGWVLTYILGIKKGCSHPQNHVDVGMQIYMVAASSGE